MDSGNSASLQSSSGDDEFDSRADEISAFMNNPAPSAHIGPISNPQRPPQQNTTSSSSIFDHPLSNYFDPTSRTSPPSQQPVQTPASAALLSLDMPWSKTLRSDHPNCTEITNPSMLASSSSSLHFLFGSQPQFQPHGVSSFTATQQQSPAVSIPPVPENTSAATSSPRVASAQAPVVRNPKKRSRASRRAPTTVMTTDTANFRAMVQEFTGIPAPPFTSSPFPRSRLDLYGTPSSMRSNPLDTSQQPSYLRRPFPQKVQLPSPFLTSSSSSLFSSPVIDHALGSSNSANNVTSGLNINVSPNANASLNYDMPSELGLLKQPPPLQSSTLFNMSNPILTSFLQSNAAKFSPSNSPLFGSKTSQGTLETPSNDSPLKMGVLDEFGLTHGQVNASNLSGFPGLITSDHQTAPTTDNNPVTWVNGMGSSDGTNQSQVRSGNGNFNFSRDAANGKLNNYLASPSSFHGGKGSDNVNAARGEGMMESWICSSE